MSLKVDIEKNLGSFTLRVQFETDGGITGLLGASGCGKSMTLKCIAGIEKPDRGSIILNGRTLFDAEKHINLKPQERQVGYLFQNYALFPNMTVKQNILCGLHAETDRTKKEAVCRQLLELFQLTEQAALKPSQLSGGQQQRAALARVLASHPKVLMLDEPFSALDSHLRLKLQLELQKTLADFSGDVLLVTHSRDEAYRMCTQLAIMDQGQIYPPRPTKEVFADPQNKITAVLTGCKNITPARMTGDHQVFLPEWGVTMITKLPVTDQVRAIGIRAHYFNLREQQNRFAVQFTENMEEPFEWVLQFRYAQQDAQSQAIWWRVPKEKKPPVMPAELGVAPVNVVPLYD